VVGEKAPRSSRQPRSELALRSGLSALADRPAVRHYDEQTTWRAERDGRAESEMVDASEWAQQIFNRVQGHIQSEIAVQTSYRELMDSSTSASTKMLIGMILEDEARHHETLDQIARAIRSQVEMEQIEGAVPPLGPLVHEPGLASATKRFQAIEKQDVNELRKLKHDMRDVAETTLWPLLLELMLLDSRKHLRILKFISERAKSSERQAAYIDRREKRRPQ
jgi:rubrerythrin